MKGCSAGCELVVDTAEKEPSKAASRLQARVSVPAGASGGGRARERGRARARGRSGARVVRVVRVVRSHTSKLEVNLFE